MTLEVVDGQGARVHLTLEQIDVLTRADMIVPVATVVPATGPAYMTREPYTREDFDVPLLRHALKHYTPERARAALEVTGGPDGST